MALCQMLLRDLKTYPWCILYRQLFSRLSLITLCLRIYKDLLIKINTSLVH